MAHASDDDAVPRFDGEDVSPTTERELRGWYAIGLSAEIFAVCGVGSFAPVLLEQLARENGVLRSDGTTPCIDTTSHASRLARTVASLLHHPVRRAEGDGGQCMVHFLGKTTTTSSFAMYTFSAAVFVQALVLISFSPVADYGQYRKRLLIMFSLLGAGATMSMALVPPSVFFLASVCVVVAVVCLGSSFVLLNSYLPLLASRHPSVRGQGELSAEELSTAKFQTSAELKLSTEISSTGVGLGYAAAVTAQVFSILLLVTLKKFNFSAESSPLRFVLLMVGLLWLALSTPGALWLRERPGPPLRTPGAWKARLPAVFKYIAFAWNSVWQTVKTASKLRQTWTFLIAWFILSDAVATVSGTAILFARTELHMSTIAIALLSITVTTSGISGAFAWPRISRRYNLQTKHTIIACMIMMEIIPLYGLLGSIPFIKAWGVIGLQKAWEIYPLGFIHGFVMGGLSSYCRSFYGEIIPPGSEAAFFALYAITDKGSSAIGPAIVGVIVDAVGTIRPAFAFLAILIVLPMPIMYIIDVPKGKQQAVALSNKAAVTSGGTITMEDYDNETGSEAREGLLRHDEEELR